ncbi:hypothetical protein MPTK1_8g05720 [Marchantia polymorpha subsp. ruderalis]|nr:hypothetical protein MARPO_0081s0074 [Marchantia polymorpha]BBN18814.1 hypothetical protein Mp_8g05720 [Marchantia polymorpha subsp. ruderalis]|eukprot:PTQ34354.1 hypothetical protein MARPO_0081s0074 [Marchantia polymorpha]
MASLGKIIKDDRHPLWLVDAVILSAVVYAKDPAEELKVMDREYGLPPSAKYEFISDEELDSNGFGSCKQTMIVVRSLTGGHLIVACRGTTDVYDALTDLNFIHRTMSLAVGSAHAGFLDRAKTIPLEYFRRLLVRNERIVLTGHSLGGAVASLLALRLLEATGKWCHEQVQCYTFGCPFFADNELARYINKRYRHHFVHIVSRNDIVPKLMPLAYTLYSVWYGLHVGPWGDLVSISRVVFLVVQVVNPRLRMKPERIPLLALGSQALKWIPGILQFVIHRALALVLSHQSGYGYAFAGHMVLLDTETSKLEYADVNRWTAEHHLNFHFGISSLEAVKEHSLLSYIDNIFTVQSSEMTKGMIAAGEETTKDMACSSKVEVCHATLSMKWFNRLPRQAKQKCMMDMDNHAPQQQQRSFSEKKKKPQVKRGLKSRVSCLIFARRLQEASPAFVKKEHKRRNTIKRFVMITVGRMADFARRFNTILVVSSVLGGAFQLRKHFLKNK